MASIFHRGPYQFRVLIRRHGVSLCQTFESREDAEAWARLTEGRLTGGEVIEKRTRVTLAEACDWIEGRLGKHPNARNERAHCAFWRRSHFAAWAITTIHDWDLIEWRREVLDEENAGDDGVGPSAQFGPQTCIHHLNTLSKIIQTWGRANRVAVDNPVKPGVRPGKPDGRSRRIDLEEEQALLDAAIVGSRPWLAAAIIIAIETAMRQGELVELTWDRVNLGQRYVDLIKTKNDRARRVPLSWRAVAAFESLERGDASVLPVTTNTGLFHAFRDARASCGLGDIRWHDLRHEAVSRLFEDTDLRDHEIMAISGHLTPAMLSRYTHLRTHKLADRLPGGRLNAAG